MQAQRYRPDRPHISGNDFAGSAVSAGDTFAQHAVFVNERDTEPVDLELRLVIDRLGSRKLCHPAMPIAQLLLRIGVLQTQHWALEPMRRKCLGRFATDALSRRIRSHEFGMLLLELLKLTHELVEFVVGNRGLV